MPSHPEFDQRYRPSVSDGAWGLRFPTLVGPSLPLINSPSNWPPVAVDVRVQPDVAPESEWSPSAHATRCWVGMRSRYAASRWRSTSCSPVLRRRSALSRPTLPRRHRRLRSGWDAPRFTGARFSTTAEPGCSLETRGMARARRWAGWLRPASRSSPTTSSCATAAPCSPGRVASTCASSRRGSSTRAGSWASWERGSAGVSTSPTVRRAAPLRGWIFLEWGPRTAVQRLSPVERMSRLARHRAIAVPWDDPGTLLDLAARPAFVWSRPKGWRNIEPSIATLLAQIVGE